MSALTAFRPELRGGFGPLSRFFGLGFAEPKVTPEHRDVHLPSVVHDLAHGSALGWDADTTTGSHRNQVRLVDTVPSPLITAGSYTAHPLAPQGRFFENGVFKM